MRRRRFLGRVGVAGAIGTAGCGSRGDEDREGPSEAPVSRRFRIGDDGFEVAVGDGPFAPFGVRGVNLGMAKPGRFPGEAAITRGEYDRWLAAMGELNVNVVRVYTVHPPAFYRALTAYNRSHATPIYLLHGNWIGEETLREAGDATSVSAAFDRSFRQVVDAVHGATTIAPEPGYASGTYDADVSDAVLGYVVGVEWPPAVVRETNRAAGSGGYAGEYLTAPDASPFESWLAARLDAGVAYEADEYGAQRPAAFTNWVTTDPLDHPYEPFVDEDAVSVDPDAIAATDAYDAGTFAAYHVYPYYLPLLNETPAYANYTDHRGEPNSYAGYLSDLVGATDHPLLVAEFGVPSSRGIAQRDVHGRDQGRHTEAEQGAILAAMYEDIRESDTAGGVVFSWHDEWFKRTWNLEPFSDPNRRPHWSNVQTPEQRFGLLSFDPAGAVPLDGSPDAWTDAAVASPDGEPTRVGDGADDARELTAVRVTSDAAYLSVWLELADLGVSVDWARTNYLIALGLTDRGGRPLPYGLSATAPADFVVRLGGPGASRVTVHPRYDAFAYEYGAAAGLELDRYRDPEPGDFAPLRMVINRGYTVPTTCAGAGARWVATWSRPSTTSRTSASRSSRSRRGGCATGTGTRTPRRTTRWRTSTCRPRPTRYRSGFRGSSSTSPTRAAADGSATSGTRGSTPTRSSRRSISPRRRTPRPTTRARRPNSMRRRTARTRFPASRATRSGRSCSPRRPGTDRPTRSGSRSRVGRSARSSGGTRAESERRIAGSALGGDQRTVPGLALKRLSRVGATPRVGRASAPLRERSSRRRPV